MPTYNDRGFPLYSSSESMPGWAAAYNAQSNLLATALDESEDAQKADDSVALIADLPVTGNWPGRRIFVEEDESLRVCKTLPGTWLIAYRTPLVGTITFEADWDAETGNSVERTADHVVMTFNAEKTSPVVSTELIGTLPVGYRPGSIVVFAGVVHGTGSPVAAAVAIETSGEIYVFFAGVVGGGQTKVAFNASFPI